MTKRVSLGGCVLALLVLFTTGCGTPTLKATGKVVNKGQPFQLSEKGMFIITFNQEGDKGGKAYSAETKADGSFTVVGPDGKGIPAGKYKVTVQAMDPYDKGVDKLQGKFVTGKTTLTAEVAQGKDIVVEVGQ